jgi:NADH:ubiquinone oxidoreductase subunit H
MAAVQRRRGPNVVGIYGLLQPFADALKLVVKETNIPSTSNSFLFIFAPVLSLFLSLSN